MSLTVKLTNSSARLTSQGRQVVQTFSVRETGGNGILAAAGDAVSLLRIVNNWLDANGVGPPIPEEGSTQQFDTDGTPFTLFCQEVIPRLESCDYATFQCRFSNFRYWSGPGAPVNPDPRVVFLSTGQSLVDRVPKYVKRNFVADGGSGEVDPWIIEQMIDIRANTGQLRVRVFLPNGINEQQVQGIYARQGQIHTISGERWEFRGATISEQTGGLVTGDPVFVTYEWLGEDGNAAIFEDGGDGGDTWVIPERLGFERYTWKIQRDAQGNFIAPVIETYLPDEVRPYRDPPFDNRIAPNGWQNLPGDPILG